jgi:two-component system, NtrC family, response regulator HydG
VIPPLRERREDIPLLVDSFRRRFNLLLKKEITGLAPETMELFMRYPWPGNVRELENCIERAFIVCHDSVLLPHHLPPEVQKARAEGGREAFRPADNSVLLAGNERERLLGVLRQTDWNIAKSARLLKIARNTLYQRMKALNIWRPTA